MTSKTLFSIITLAFAATHAHAQDSEAPFRIGHPDLPKGCADAAAQTDETWSAYLTLLSERLGRPVIGCGYDESDAASALESGELDFAIAKIASFQDGAETSIRPILSVRAGDEAQRTELIVVSAEQEMSAEQDWRAHAKLIGWTKNDLKRGAAVIDQVFADSDAAESHASEVIAQTDGWREGEPTEDAKTAIGSLNAEDAPSALVLPMGRFQDLCDIEKTLCEHVKPLWRGFAPISTAYTISPTVTKDVRYRLIGIHFSLHHEHPEMVARLAGEDGAAFEPTEPQAFYLKSTL